MRIFSIRTFCLISCRRWRCRVWGGRKTLAPHVIPHTVGRMRIVIDTNVIVSGLRSTKGASFRVLRGVQTGVVKPVVSVALFLEYQDVLPRPGLLPAQMPPHAILAFLDAFLLKSELQDIFFKWRPWLPDPKDECVLDTAVAAGCIPIVTSNLKDFRPAPRLGVRVMTPWEVVTELNLP